MAPLIIYHFLQFINSFSSNIDEKEVLLEELFKLKLDGDEKSICG